MLLDERAAAGKGARDLRRRRGDCARRGGHDRRHRHGAVGAVHRQRRRDAAAGRVAVAPAVAQRQRVVAGRGRPLQRGALGAGADGHVPVRRAGACVVVDPAQATTAAAAAAAAAAAVPAAATHATRAAAGGAAVAGGRRGRAAAAALRRGKVHRALQMGQLPQRGAAQRHARLRRHDDVLRDGLRVEERVHEQQLVVVVVVVATPRGGHGTGAARTAAAAAAGAAPRLGDHGGVPLGAAPHGGVRRPARRRADDALQARVQRLQLPHEALLRLQVRPLGLQVQQRLGQRPAVAQHEVDARAERGARHTVRRVDEHRLARVQRLLDEAVDLVQHRVGLVEDDAVARLRPVVREVAQPRALKGVRQLAARAVDDAADLVGDDELEVVRRLKVAQEERLAQLGARHGGGGRGGVVAAARAAAAAARGGGGLSDVTARTTQPARAPPCV